MSEGYNGYSNYETWCVQLWIDNEQGLSCQKDDLVEQADDVYELSKLLKAWIEDDKDELCTVPGMFGDLLQAALDSVNWYEIAENYFEEKEVEDDDEDDEDEDDETDSQGNNPCTTWVE